MNTEMTESVVAVGLPAIAADLPGITGIEYKANEKAVDILLTTNREELQHQAVLIDSVFAAVGECESYPEWMASVGAFRGKVHELKAEVAPSVKQYLSTFTAAWKSRAERGTDLIRNYGLLREFHHDEACDKFEAPFQRAKRGEFLNPLAGCYSTGSAYLRDVQAVKEIAKQATAAVNAEKKRQAAKAEAAGNEAVGKRGEVKQTGNLPDTVQNALNGVILAVHGVYQVVPEAALCGYLNNAAAVIARMGRLAAEAVTKQETLTADDLRNLAEAVAETEQEQATVAA